MTRQTWTTRDTGVITGCVVNGKETLFREPVPVTSGVDLWVEVDMEEGTVTHLIYDDGRRVEVTY